MYNNNNHITIPYFLKNDVILFTLPTSAVAVVVPLLVAFFFVPPVADLPILLLLLIWLLPLAGVVEEGFEEEEVEEGR